MIEQLKEVFGHCGKQGRLYRIVIRDGLRGREIPQETMNKASEHVWSCPCCRNKVAKAIVKNVDQTVYQETIELSILTAQARVFEKNNTRLSPPSQEEVTISDQLRIIPSYSKEDNAFLRQVLAELD